MNGDGVPLAAGEAGSANVVSYAFLRHVGFILDELSYQGLQIWQDETHLWHWCWAATDLRGQRGFWALGEALVDAVAARYPAVFGVNTVAT